MDLSIWVYYNRIEMVRTTHPVERIERVAVDPDEIVEALQYNLERETSSKTAVLRIQSFEEETEAELFHEQCGNRYPPELSPKPIHVDPRTLVDQDEVGQYTIRAEEKLIIEETPGIGADEETVDEWHDESVELWSSDVRGAIRDEIELEIRTGPEPEDIIEVEIDIAVETP